MFLVLSALNLVLFPAYIDVTTSMTGSFAIGGGLIILVFGLGPVTLTVLTLTIVLWIRLRRQRNTHWKVASWILALFFGYAALAQLQMLWY